MKFYKGVDNMSFKLLRRNVLGYTFTFICFIIILFNIVVFSMGQNKNFKIVTLKGDEDIIRDIKIKGYLGDMEAQFAVEIDGSNIRVDALHGSKKRTIQPFYNYIQSIRGSSYSNVLVRNSAWYTMYFVENHNTRDEHYVLISKTKGLYSNAYESKAIKMDMKLDSKKYPRYFGYREVSASNMVNIMEYINGKLYFVIPSDINSKGNSGIYEISSFDKGDLRFYLTYSTVEDEILNNNKIKKLQSIDLENGRVQIKGLYGCEEYLYIILIVEDNLMVKLYSLKEEKFIDEGLVNEMIFDPSVHLIRNATLNDKKLSIVLSNQNSTNIITVDFDQQSKIATNITIDYDFYYEILHDENYYRDGSIHDLILKNNLIYIIDEQRETSLHYDSLGNRKEDYYLRLSAYDKAGELKYTGRIDTSINGDAIINRVDTPTLIEKYRSTSNKRIYYDFRFSQ
jgi:hypothetical protein